jgi:enoyl-CoA hydratase
VVLRVAVEDTRWTITLDRPERRNALNRELLRALLAALRDFDADPDARVAVLTGADPAFCAGMDLYEMAGSGVSLDLAADTYDTVMRSVRKPIIGAVNGAAITGGLEIALGCDFLIASDRARFGDTHARVGVIAGGGVTVMLAQAVGVRMARQLSYTGELIDARTALRAGLVNEVVPHAELLPRARAIATMISDTEPVMISAFKDAYWRAGNLPVDEALVAERTASANHPVPASRVASARDDVIRRGSATVRPPSGRPG